MRGRHLEQSDAVASPAPGAGADGPYRIHTVSELTGVPEPTLRAWERRYGIPTPRRTAAGYRLYGHEEVSQVRTMQRLCAEGMAAAEAARVIARSSRAGSARRGSRSAQPLDGYVAAVDAIVAAVERFDDVGLDLQLRAAMFLGSVGTVADRVIQPALERIGEMWHEGTLSVAQEHFASHRLGTTMRDLVRLSVKEEATTRAIVACFADEEHEIGALSVAVRLASWGTRPVVLGARTPPEAIRAAILALDPKLVALSVSVTPEPERARALVEGYAGACGRVPWMVGGAGVAPLAEAIRKAGGLVAPDDNDAVRAFVRRALGERAPRPPSPQARSAP